MVSATGAYSDGTPMAEQPEVIILIPKEMLGDGEAGDPLTKELIDLINVMSDGKWWPFDFGEQTDKGTALYFILGVTVAAAKNQADHFIQCGGYV